MKSIVAGCLSLRGDAGKARDVLRGLLDGLNEEDHAACVETARVKADVIHRLALSFVQEGNKSAALPLWKAVIERVNEVEDLDASLADQVRHARALIIACIHASKNTNVHTIEHDEADAGNEDGVTVMAAGVGSSTEQRAEEDSSMTPEVRKLVEKRLNDLEYLDEAKKSLQAALESPDMYKRVFEDRLERPKTTFESLWPGFTNRFD